MEPCKMNYTIRQLRKTDIDSYVRLIKNGYREAEQQGIHYSAYRKSREELMKWLINVPTWGLFSDKGVLVSSLSLQFAWNRSREERKDDMVMLKYGAVLPGYKGKGCFSSLFRWLERNILQRMLRLDAIYIETNPKLAKFDGLYMKALGFHISDRYHGTNGCVVIVKEYTYDCVPDAVDYDESVEYLDFTARLLTEKNVKEYRELLRMAGERNRLKTGTDLSSAHYTEEECRYWLVNTSVFGIFDEHNVLVYTSCTEFPWQLPCREKKRLYPYFRQSAILDDYYKSLGMEKLRHYRNNISYRWMFKDSRKFSLHHIMDDYMMGGEADMFRFGVSYLDCAYGSTNYRFNQHEAGFETVEHIYNYSSAPHYVLMRRKFRHE